MKWRRQSFCLLSGSEEYNDNCWKWLAFVSIELSGEYSRFYVRNILLCFRNSGLSKVVLMSILCFFVIMNRDLQLIEGAIEPYYRRSVEALHMSTSY